MPDVTKLHFAGHLSCQTRHAEGLASILSSFFVVPVRIECFIGTWLGDARGGPHAARRIATHRRARSHTAVLGARVWSRQHKFRVVVGPLDLRGLSSPVARRAAACIG